MRKRKRRLCLIFAVFFLFLCFGNDVCVHASTVSWEEQGRILFISSYSYAWDSVQLQIEGIKTGVNGQAVVDYEFMDTKRVDDEKSMQMFYEGLSYRLSKVKPYDVVILGDDAALLFAIQYREELFDHIPLVFEGINDIDLAVELSDDPLITGIVEKLSLEKNIEMGKNFYPEAKKVVAILDDSITGQAERKAFYAEAGNYPELEFTEINTSELTSKELALAISKVKKDSILLFCVMTEDASGRQYTNTESIRFIAKYANVPAFRTVDGGIGEGLLGGSVASMQQSGETAAEIAMEIIHGKSVGDIDIVMESPDVYYIDESVMEKFGLDMSLVPEDAIIVHHRADFWERNKEVLLPGIAIMIVLGLIICWMLYDNFKRRKLMLELEEARAIMESAAQHDFLTGIANRSKFIEDLHAYLAEETECTVMMLDIDNFKQINDTYGHTAGDEAVKQLAERMKAIRTTDFIPYRFAGDEFIFLLKGSQKDVVDRAVLRCRQMFEKPFVLSGEKHWLGGSIGVAAYPENATNAEQLVIYADHAMYHVKKSGKNDVAFFSQTQETQMGV